MTKNGKQKFMFDLHIFDEEEEEEEIVEDLPPPPPTFSEEELEAAKRKAFEEGRQKGIEEQTQSRDNHIAQLLQLISQDTHTLFESEAAREKCFEVEAVQLSLAVFEKLFPLYHKAKGFEELRATLEQILQSCNGQSKIRIETAASEKEAIESHLQNLPAGGPEPLQFEVIANDTLGEGTCKLSWSDGGAIRDIEAMADEIRAILQEILAQNGTNSHDSGIETSGPASETAPDNPGENPDAQPDNDGDQP